MSKFFIKVAAVSLVLIMALTASSCSVFQTPNIGISTSDTIGMTGHLVSEIEELAARNGYPVSVLSADGMYDVQEMQVASLLAQDGLNVLAICPVNSTNILTSISAAKEAGVPIVLFERPMDNPDIAFFGGYDAAEEGRLAAQAIIENDDGKDNVVVEILGPADNPNAVNASKGFHEVIDKISNITVIQVVSEWNVQAAYEGMCSALRKNPTLSAIYCSNSTLDAAVDEALKEIGLLKISGTQDHVFRVSVGGSKNGYDSTVNGYVDLLIVTDVESEAKAIFEALMTLGNGKNLETTTYTAGSTSYTQEDVERNASNIWGYVSEIK